MPKQNQKVFITTDPEMLFRNQKMLQAKKAAALLIPAGRLGDLPFAEELCCRLKRGEIFRLDFSKMLSLQPGSADPQRTVAPFVLMTRLQDFRQMLMTFRYWGWEEFSFGVFFFDGPRQSEQDRLFLAEFGFCVMASRALSHFLDYPRAIQLLEDLSPSDRRLLNCLSYGMTNAQIAWELGLPLTRVKTLVRALLSRLHLENRTRAAVLAYWMRTKETEKDSTENKHRVAPEPSPAIRAACQHEKEVSTILRG